MPDGLRTVANGLLATLPWSVVLPAGCGKTELVAAIAASVEEGRKPLLVLTHTNAGVDVVRKRFKKYAVKPSKAYVLTLDAWSKYLNDHFPLLGNAAGNPHPDHWTNVRQRTQAVLTSQHIGDILAASYSAVIVDEYQDCSQLQHELVVAMGRFVPVGVLGDPLQGIFDFGPGVIDWQLVESAFPPQALIPTPHRWSTENPSLGQWLLDIRDNLQPGATLNLSTNGVPVIWQEATANLKAERQHCMQAASGQNQVVALRQQPVQCYKFARSLGGIYDVGEEIECKVVKGLAEALDGGNGGAVAGQTLAFVRSCCTGIPSNPFNDALVNQYLAGNAKRYNANNGNAPIFDALNGLLANPTAAGVKTALTLLNGQNQKVFRKEAWRVGMQFLEELSYGSEKSAVKTLEDVRSRSRYGEKFVSPRSVSRTLLVKGQEYDECIILDADGMTVRNLYVALSRGVKRVTVFSSQHQITLGTF